MSIGKSIRMNSIFNPDDGKCVMLPVDHNFLVGPIRGLENVEETLRRALRGRLDAVMVSPGQAKRLAHLFGKRGSPALVVRGDWSNAFREKVYTLPVRSIQEILIAHPRDLLRLGATGAVIYYFTGYGDEKKQAQHYERMRWFIKNCEVVGLPCLVTVMPMGEKISGANFVDFLELGVRMAVEAGADMLEVPYTQDIDTFRRIVVAAKGVPVLCAGGPKAARLRDTLEIVVELLHAGASGIVFGRQVFQSEDPVALLNMLYALVHEGKTVEEVLGLIGRRIRLKTLAEKCIGCRLCEIICSSSHGSSFSMAKARLHVKEAQGKYMISTCTLCGLCAKVCPTGAIKVNVELGILELEEEKCIGCGKCVEACPTEVLKLDERSKPLICDRCQGDPQCAKWCPVEAIITEVY
jgi:class I fructose-bisphosphate aldolase